MGIGQKRVDELWGLKFVFCFGSVLEMFVDLLRKCGLELN